MANPAKRTRLGKGRNEAVLIAAGLLLSRLRKILLDNAYEL